MASYFALTERAAQCPACHAQNMLIGSDLLPGTEIYCSRCHSYIGVWSETQSRYAYKNDGPVQMAELDSRDRKCNTHKAQPQAIVEIGGHRQVGLEPAHLKT